MRTLLRALVDQREWQTYDVFRFHFERAASELAEIENNPGLANLSVSDSTYQRWYYGSGRPHPGSRRVLRHLFGYSVDELWAEEPVPACPADEVSASHTEHWAGPGTDDRNEMGRSAAMAARRAMAFAMGAERGEVGPETLGFLQDQVRRIAETYIRVPLGTVLDDLVEVQDETFRLLESGRTKPSQSRDLYLLAALASGMLAKAGHDLGDPSSAMMQARTAAVCADKAEHKGMGTWVRGLQSLISYWAERPEDAMHYARQGAAMGEGLRGSVSVWLAGLEARAAALLGDEHIVRAASERASDLRDQVIPDDLDALGGLLVFPQVRQDYYTVEAEVLIGGDSQLTERAEQVVHSYSDTSDPHWAFSDAAGAQTSLALARLHHGDLAGTAEAMRPVLDLPANRRNAGIIYSAERVREALLRGPVRNALAAREIREEIAMFRRPTLALPR
ncbi:hypothetical protein ACFWAT_09905 [Streptomyces syringium]|uniref:hypothetical protein n=1 Tax=Streptomyces syringium TaxID=76729 RepID=UPI0036619A23